MFIKKMNHERVHHWVKEKMRKNFRNFSRVSSAPWNSVGRVVIYVFESILIISRFFRWLHTSESEASLKAKHWKLRTDTDPRAHRNNRWCCIVESKVGKWRLSKENSGSGRANKAHSVVADANSVTAGRTQASSDATTDSNRITRFFDFVIVTTSPTCLPSTTS